MSKLPDYQIRAINDAETSENKIHSDEIARKYGFTGALVSGVSVFGYLTHPLVEAYGADWLGSGVGEVKFLKPAYVDDMLTIKTETIRASGQRWHLLSQAFNDAGVLLAQLDSWLPLLPPQPDPKAATQTEATQATDSEIDRQEISFERIQLNQPAPDFTFTVGSELQQECLAIMRDNLEQYSREEATYVHPYYLLKQCNLALMRIFVLPAWVHTGSTLVIHGPIIVGQTVNVLTIPTDKWENKGHQFIKLYIAMKVADKVMLEVEHTAIFRLAD